MTFGEEQYEMIWCKKTKAYVKWCRPAYKSLALWLCEQDLVTFFLTIQKFSTRIHHVTGIVRQSIERTITHNCRNFIEWYGYT